MNKRELKESLNSDLFRYAGKTGTKTFLYYFFLYPGFRYSYFYRICHYSRSQNPNFLRKIQFYLLWYLLHHYQIKYGYQIPCQTKIGNGLIIYHYGSIVVNSDVIIGKNCCLSTGVTIGMHHRGGKKGNPIIGDNVYIAPGAKIIGNIKIGNNVIIGTNSVVVDDVPNNAVVGGIPAKVLSYAGAEGYIKNPVD
jgi:serine O-acetyltransferase